MASASDLVRALRESVEREAEALGRGDAAAFSEAAADVLPLLTQLSLDPPQDPAIVDELRALEALLSERENVLRDVVQRHGLQLQELLKSAHRPPQMIDRMA